MFSPQVPVRDLHHSPTLTHHWVLPVLPSYLSNRVFCSTVPIPSQVRLFSLSITHNPTPVVFSSSRYACHEPLHSSKRQSCLNHCVDFSHCEEPYKRLTILKRRAENSHCILRVLHNQTQVSVFRYMHIFYIWPWACSSQSRLSLNWACSLRGLRFKPPSSHSFTTPPF